MKKFQFAAGLLTLAMLGACSSDAPDQPGNQVENDIPAGFVAMRIATANQTRAEGTDNGKSAEQQIQDVTLYVLTAKEGGGYKTVRKLISSGITNDLAYFDVTSTQYDDLKDLAGKDVYLRVYANAQTTDATGDPLPDDYTTGGTTDLIPWNNNSFLMTNVIPADEKPLKLSPIGENVDPKVQASAWVINGGGEGEQGTIVLERLASRFDLINKGSYTATSDSKLTITIESAAFNTHEDECYWFAQTPLRTPGGFTVPTSLNTFKQHTWTWTMPTEANGVSTRYGRPHVIGSSVSSINYRSASYVAFKATFTHQTLGKGVVSNNEKAIKVMNEAGDAVDDAKTKAEDAKTVYSYNGYLLGTFNEFLNTKPTDYPADIKTWVEKTQASRTLTPESLADANGTEAYTKDPDNGNKYYTYYCAILTNEKAAEGETLTLTKENTQIKRNHLYTISVSSIKGLGFCEKDQPQDPKTPDQTLYINLDVEVSPWTTNNSNEGLEL